MKPAITTITLLVVNVLLLGYIFLIDSGRPGTIEGDVAKRKLISYEEENVSRLVITSSEGKAEIAKLPDGSWRFVSPFEDRFDPILMKDLLENSNLMFIRNTITEKENKKAGHDDAYFGLGKGAIGMELFSEEGEKLGSITVGAPTPTEGLVYARREGDDSADVHSVDGYMREVIANSFDELRDRRLIYAKVDDVYRVKFHPPPAGLMEVHVEKGLDKKWRMLKPLVAPAEEELVKDLVSNLAKLEVAGFVDEAGVDMAAAFDENRYEIILRQRTPAADNAKVVINFGKEPTDPNDPYVLASVSDRKGVLFKVDRRVHYELGMSDSNALRDRTLADFDYNAVSRVHIERKWADPEEGPQADEILLVRGRSGWAIQRNPDKPTELEAANSGMIKDLIDKINDEPVVKFADDAVADLAQYGLAEPPISVEITRLYIDPKAEVKEGEEPVMIPIKKKLLLGVSRQFQPFPQFFATFEGEPYVYEIDQFLISRLRLEKALSYRTLQLWPKFTAFDLRRVTIKDQISPDALTLDYNHERNSWKAMLGAVDVTDEIEKVVLDGYLATLGRPPRGGDWTEPEARSIQRLSNPGLTVTIDLIDPIDRKTPRRIEFLGASTKDGGKFYYGRINRGSDVILLDDAVIQSLRMPLKRLTP